MSKFPIEIPKSHTLEKVQGSKKKGYPIRGLEGSEGEQRYRSALLIIVFLRTVTQ